MHEAPLACAPTKRRVDIEHVVIIIIIAIVIAIIIAVIIITIIIVTIAQPTCSFPDQGLRQQARCRAEAKATDAHEGSSRAERAHVRLEQRQWRR